MESTYKLLLIDDDKVDRSIFQRFLKKSNISCDIHECAYGLKSISVLESVQFDFVFVDYNLPDINGIDLLKQILQTDPNASVVLMTGGGDELLAALAMKCGASDYLPKDALSSVVLTQCIKNIEMRKAKEEAEQHNRAKSEFLSRMSHELRTPMNAILGFAQLMKESKKDPLSPGHQSRVSHILKAGSHLLELINDVLDLSRIESEEFTLSIEPLAVTTSIEEVLSIARPIAEQFGIELIDEIASHKDIFVFGDQTRLKQVLLNLISNGIKYNRRGGSVTVASEINDDGTLRIKVKDTGMGIPSDKLASLFHPFDRLGAEFSEVEGTGIGLTISKKLIESMNGSIGVDTFVGEGSEFYITLQICSALENDLTHNESQESEKDSESSTSDDTFSLLYIEDNPYNLKLVEDILEEYSEIKLLSAPQAKMGLELAQAHKPDLILMDINLPEMDGIEAFKRLQNFEQTCDIPVIALSANAMQGDIDKALKTGFTSYITKPIDIDNFRTVIEKAIEENSLSED